MKNIKNMDFIIEIDKMNEKNRKEYLLAYTERISAVTKEKTEAIVHKMVEERHAKGLSQQNIAEVTGVAAPNIARFESCKVTPTLQMLVKYADALGMQLNIELTQGNEMEG